MVLSHHRSGSNFLCNLLCANKDVVCLNEPLSMHTDFFKSNDLITWRGTEYNENFLHNSLSDQKDLINYLKDLRAYMMEESIDRAIGFKETLLFEKLEWFKKFMPDIKIVYIVRDPRAIVNSVLRNDMYKLWDYETTVKRYLKNTSVKIDTPIELAVWSIKIRHELFMKYKDLFNYKIIKLENIVNNSLESTNEIMGFLNKDISSEQKEFLQEVYCNEKKGERFSVYTTKDRVLNDWKSKVSDENEEYIKRILHDEMEEFGYLQ